MMRDKDCFDGLVCLSLDEVHHRFGILHLAQRVKG